MNDPELNEQRCIEMLHAVDAVIKRRLNKGATMPECIFVAANMLAILTGAYDDPSSRKLAEEFAQKTLLDRQQDLVIARTETVGSA